MYISTALACEIYDFAAELGERFPDMTNSQVISVVNEAFESELEEIITDDMVFAITIITAYTTESTQAALEQAHELMPVRYGLPA